MTVELGPTFGLHSVHQFHSGPLAIHPRVFSRPPFSFTVTICLPLSGKNPPSHTRLRTRLSKWRPNGTRTRGLLRDRQRSNQLNYAPASKINSSRLPRVPPDAHRFPKLPENAVTVHGSE
jgi:hypothetical protein